MAISPQQGSMASTSGPSSTMYSLKPFYTDDNIVLPDVMYKMKSFYGSEDVKKPDGSTGYDIDALEKRQEAILAKLSELQKEVQKLSNSCPPTLSQKRESTSGAVIDEIIEDVVITANPSSPPLSLFVLYQLLQQQLRTVGSMHVHSSVTSVPENLKVFQNGFQSNRRDYQLAITLIWKNVNHGPELMVNPHKQSPVQGEGNMARYLARLLSPGYDSVDPITATEIDVFVDIATNQLLHGNSKEKAAALRGLNSKLGSSSWLVGSDLSLADIVVWSALQQTGQAGGAPANVQKWIKACNNNFAFKLALSVMS
ncbi:aminoacyl tRNA synthase complex-interacting multifunctional protein 2 [Lingula anatina]|uniref:Aminoacyl tRNA synthase complex-interacting multifunctional protein 2 n=1 Tax=Lingula anatina TaxID=7574 RepID=A0A1S3JBW5_LINAN|nr:aminoacyl tRNA synthase complex-interacting multifunctional protein 2 [Lingula anatina]|eukprot:XP_013407676.1 aminoacyl tRNA synthase complex-interacting multifunctional protein 2 [Lingula anatina]